MHGNNRSPVVIGSVAPATQPVRAMSTAGPPFWELSILMAGWDPSDGLYHILNLGTLHQGQILAEKANILGIVDGRDAITCTIAAAAAIGATNSADLEVPAGEVWFLHLIEVTSPAESGVGVGDIVQVNFRCDVWPDTASALGQAYWTANQGTVALDTLWAEFNTLAPLWDVKGVPEVLRLPPGAKITLEATLTGAIAGANLVPTLTPYGYKGRYLVS